MTIFTRLEIWGSALSCSGCVLLVPACILLNYPKQSMGGWAAIATFVMASLGLMLAAMVDIWASSIHANSTSDPLLIDKEKRAIKTSCFQLIGASFFLIASLSTLPHFSDQLVFDLNMDDVGIWIFRFGSISYLGGSYRLLMDLFRRVQKQEIWLMKDVINLMAIGAFVFGSLFYIAGGVVGQMKLGAASLMIDLWVIGSVCFSVGSFIFAKEVLHRVGRS